MDKVKQTNRKGKYTLEFKMEAVRQVLGGQAAAVTARVMGVPKQTLYGWLADHAKGPLQGAGTKPVTAEQMELARLRAECMRLKMERDILKIGESANKTSGGCFVRRARTSRGSQCEVRMD
jgi:transposase-like protein